MIKHRLSVRLDGKAFAVCVCLVQVDIHNRQPVAALYMRQHFACRGNCHAVTDIGKTAALAAAVHTEDEALVFDGACL